MYWSILVLCFGLSGFVLPCIYDKKWAYRYMYFAAYSALMLGISLAFDTRVEKLVWIGGLSLLGLIVGIAGDASFDRELGEAKDHEH